VSAARRIGFLTVVILAAVGCGGSTTSEAPAEEQPEETPHLALARARDAARALGKDLSSRLFAELGSGGPAAALKVCADVAQEASASHSVDGLTVRRVSTKPRNTADEPDDYERARLEEYASIDVNELPEETWEIVEADDARILRYMRPITIKQPCLACHGNTEKMDAEVVAFLQERYPEDKATGYRAGDLRGAVTVTVELD
jgi:hypothetical protein